MSGGQEYVYFDACATVAVRDEALEVYTDVARRFVANPSSSHGLGARAKGLLEETREGFSELLGCRPKEIFFTSGGTEAANTLVASFDPSSTILVGATEHHAVLTRAEKVGARPLGVHRSGVIDFEAAKAAFKASKDSLTAVFLMAVNNETGAIQPIEHIGTLLKRIAPQAKLVVDAIQAPHWFNLATLLSPADASFLAGHKFGAPKGFGLMMARDPKWLRPLLIGGGQEADRRSGTQDVAAAAAALVALRLAQDEVQLRRRSALEIRRRLFEGISTLGDRVIFTGAEDETVPGVLSLLVPGASSEEVLFLLDQMGVCASAGSACASGALDPSHVLLAMGFDRALARSSLRLSFTGDECEADVERVAQAVCAVVDRLTR